MWLAHAKDHGKTDPIGVVPGADWFGHDGLLSGRGQKGYQSCDRKQGQNVEHR